MLSYRLPLFVQSSTFCYCAQSQWRGLHHYRQWHTSAEIGCRILRCRRGQIGRVAFLRYAALQQTA